MKRTLITLVAALACSLALSSFATTSGKSIYEKSCAACHMNGVAQAPKVHDTKAWDARLKNAEAAVKKIDPSLKGKALQAKAIDYLVANVKKGLGVMPPRGMCASCTDAQYKSAIEYMMKAKKG